MRIMQIFKCDFVKFCLLLYLIDSSIFFLLFRVMFVIWVENYNLRILVSQTFFVGLLLIIIVKVLSTLSLVLAKITVDITKLSHVILNPHYGNTVITNEIKPNVMKYQFSHTVQCNKLSLSVWMIIARLKSGRNMNTHISFICYMFFGVTVGAGAARTADNTPCQLDPTIRNCAPTSTPMPSLEF